MNFISAIKWLSKGGTIKRIGWERHIYVRVMPEDKNSSWTNHNNWRLEYNLYDDGFFQPWLPTFGDYLAKDWEKAQQYKE